MNELRQPVASQPLNFKEVFVGGRWQEAIFLTYSFDLPFFESYMLPELVRNGCRSIAVAACASWLPERLQAWLESGELREAGRSYTLSSVSVPGVFHPKLVLAVAKDRGIALIGSGNISAYGMAMGGELFTKVEWQNDDVSSLAREAWQICREVARRLPVDKSFAERVEAMGRLVPALALPSDRALVHNLSHSLLDQFLRYLPDGEVEEIIVWSPFTDHRLDALDALVLNAHPSRLILGVQPDLTSLDGTRLAILEKQWGDVSLEIRALCQRDASRSSLIHAKGILATMRSGEEIALLGSPNLSAPALLRTVSTGNFELAILHRGRDLRDRIFGEASVITLGEMVESSRLAWIPDPTTSDEPTPRPTLQLLGARQDGDWLAVEIKGSTPPDAEIVLDGTSSLQLTRGKDGLGAPLSGGIAPQTAELVWDAGHSGPVVIADLARLAAMRRGRDSLPHSPLEALDYGADGDIIALLDQLAQLAIGSVYDLDRMLRGSKAPTPQEEADEARGQAPPLRLEDIDFERIRQHPRANAYGSNRADVLDAPRIQLWLDEVVRQFESLRERQLLRLVQPIITDESEEERPATGEDEERYRWPVSRRIAVRVLNRLRRYVSGIGDPRFWRLVEPAWMASNYVLFLSLLERLWVRAATDAAILTPEELGPLTVNLTSYWGDDRGAGYFSQLPDEAQWVSAVLLTDSHGDALSTAACIRLLELQGDVGRSAPFSVGAYVRVAKGFGLMTDEVIERALTFLDRSDEAPGSHLQRLNDTALYFSWDRFVANLAWRHDLRSAVLLADVPGLGRFVSGEVLVVDGGEDVSISGATTQVFGEWVQEVSKRDPSRRVIQMVWGNDLILLYNTRSREVLTRATRTEPGVEPRTIAAAVSPEQISTLTFDESIRATA